MSDENGFVFRDNSLYVMTPSGPIRLTSDASLQPGEFWFEQPATVTTTCARCSATIDPAAVERHHERCFVVGDCVRWENSRVADMWAEGEITSPPTGRHGTFTMHAVRAGEPAARYIGFSSAWGIGKGCSLRHIQRPGQAERSCCPGATTGHVCGCDPIETRAAAYHKLVAEAPGPIGCAHDDDDPELQDAMERVEPIAPTLYDGLTAEQCLERYTGNMQRADDTIPWPLSPVQLTAARELWSLHLKQRISAAKERERLSVTYCEVDVDD